MAKRNATTELTHDNWDQEEESEEAGTFKQVWKIFLSLFIMFFFRYRFVKILVILSISWHSFRSERQKDESLSVIPNPEFWCSEIWKFAVEKFATFLIKIAELKGSYEGQPSSRRSL